MSQTPSWLQEDSGDATGVPAPVSAPASSAAFETQTAVSDGNAVAATNGGSTVDEADLPSMILIMRLANMGVAIALVTCSVSRTLVAAKERPKEQQTRVPKRYDDHWMMRSASSLAFRQTTSQTSVRGCRRSGRFREPPGLLMFETLHNHHHHHTCNPLTHCVRLFVIAMDCCVTAGDACCPPLYASAITQCRSASLPRQVFLMLSLGNLDLTNWVLSVYACCGGLLICCLETQLKFVRVIIAVNFGFLFHSIWRFLFYILLASVAWTYDTLFGRIVAFTMAGVALFNTYVLCRYPSYRAMRERIAEEEDKRIEARISKEVKKQAVRSLTT